MIILLLFAFLAGAATAITPCVLPVLPAVLSASGTGGRRRPLGIVAGLTLTHTITIVGIASVVDGVGFADGTLRTAAIVVLALFGMTLLVPPAGYWIAERMSGLARLRPRSAGEGFWSGLPVGGALGFAYAPCAGPILAAVISVSASQGTTTELAAVGVAYGLGSATVLLGLALGGRRVIDRVRRGGRGPALQRGFGAIMVLTAVLMLTSVDLRFQTALASHLPTFLTNPTHGLERSSTVEDRLASLRGKPEFDAAAVTAKQPATTSDAALPGVSPPALPLLGRAPDFANAQRWLHSTPLTMAGLRGRVVLVDFWTYTCINCIATLPYLRAWDERYRRRGLTIVGVHTPEFAFEKSASNVADAIGRNGLRYPVVLDNEYGTWNAFGNQFWPAKYLIDAGGQVRYTHFGEGHYDETEGRDPLTARRGRRSPPRWRGTHAWRAVDGGARRDPRDLPRRRACAELLAGRPASRHARLRDRRPRVPPAERLLARWALGGRRRVRPSGAPCDAARSPRGQGRLPRPVLEGRPGLAACACRWTAGPSAPPGPPATCTTVR